MATPGSTTRRYEITMGDGNDTYTDDLVEAVETVDRGYGVYVWDLTTGEMYTRDGGWQR